MTILQGGHEDESILSPTATPRVLHLDEVLATLVAKTNSQDTVVKTGGAVAWEDTLLVQLETDSTSVDGNTKNV